MSTNTFDMEKPILRKELPDDVISYLREKYPPRINGAGIEQSDNVNYITEELSFFTDENVMECVIKYGMAPLGILWFLRLQMSNTLGWGIDVTDKEYQRLCNNMTLDLYMSQATFEKLCNALIECGVIKVVYGSNNRIYWTTLQQFYNYEYKSWSRLKNNAAARRSYQNKVSQQKATEPKTDAPEENTLF